MDDLGGALLSWFTPNPYDRIWREDIPPLEAMARFILDYFVTGSPVNQIKYIEKMIADSGSKGMMFYTYVGARTVEFTSSCSATISTRKGCPVRPGGQLAGGCAVGATENPRARLHRDAVLAMIGRGQGYKWGMVWDCRQMEAMT